MNLLVTMFISGLWHGAGLNFIVWGLLHGLMLAVHRWWRHRPGGVPSPRFSARAFSWLLHFCYREPGLGFLLHGHSYGALLFPPSVCGVKRCRDLPGVKMFSNTSLEKRMLPRPAFRWRSPISCFGESGGAFWWGLYLSFPAKAQNLFISTSSSDRRRLTECLQNANSFSP